MSLKQRLTSGDILLGTFLKTPHHHIVEVLAHSQLDVLCLDAEHAPYSRADLDTNILAARAVNMPLLVRTPNDDPHTLLNALDLGATGVVVPHVKTAAQLETIVRHCHYGAGGRGYAGSSRFAHYTNRTLSENLRAGSQSVVIAQLEDIEALDNIDSIVQVENVDCLFIGRMDLTVALGEKSPKAQPVINAVEKIITAAQTHNKVTGMFVGDLNELSYWKSKGVQLFLLASDHNFLLNGAAALKQQFDKA